MPRQARIRSITGICIRQLSQVFGIGKKMSENVIKGDK